MSLFNIFCGSENDSVDATQTMIFLGLVYIAASITPLKLLIYSIVHPA